MAIDKRINKLEIRNLCKSFGESQVLKDISFEIADGEFAAVMGRSGCGKSTLLYCVSGMEIPTSGEIRFEGQEMSALSDKEMERQRLQHMGFIFQRSNFLKNLSVADNIVFPAFQLGKRSREEIRDEAEEMMKQLGILSVADHDIRQVSGGQLQRAAICRAMINHPGILFGDEPTGALNSGATQEVMDIVSKINHRGTSILFVTHDSKVASRADHIIYLEDGQMKDELRPGKYTDSARAWREQEIQRWLERMKF